MNNKLSRTDTIWGKIRKFFRKFFKKEQCNTKYELQEKLKENEFNESLKESITKYNQTQSLASQLLVGEVGCSELTDSQVDEMTEYFKNDMKKLDNELSRIKKHILGIKQQLQ